MKPALSSSTPWQSKAFRLLFSAHAISLMGSGLSSVAIGLLAHELVGASATTVLGFILTIRILVIVFLSPWAGILAEKWGMKRTLLLSDLFRAFIVIGFLFASNVWHIYLLAFFLNLGSAMFTPVYKSAIPGVVSEKGYPKALAWGVIAYDLANILGPVFAALLITLTGFRGNFLFDSATFLISAALLFGLPRIGRKKQSIHPPLNRTHGIRAMLGRWPLRVSLLLAFQISVAGAFVLVATIGFIKEELGLKDIAYAWVMTAYGLGSTTGSFLYGRLESLRKQLIGIAGPLMFTTLFLSGFIHEYGILFPAWFLLGSGQAILGIRGNELLALGSNQEERPHIYAAHFSLSHAGWALTYPLAGLSVSAIGFSKAALVFACLFGLVSLPLWSYSLWIAWIHRRLPNAAHSHKHTKPEWMHSHTHRHGNIEHTHTHFHS